jgi:hypothetical protein
MCLGVPSDCYCDMEYEDPIGLSRTCIKMPRPYFRCHSKISQLEIMNLLINGHNLFFMQVGARMTVQTHAVNSFGRVFDSSQVHFCLALCVWKLNYIRWFTPNSFNLDV